MATYVYSNCATLSIGCFLYEDSGLTTAVSDGRYSDGTNCYRVTGGSGEIVGSTSCSSPCECHEGTISNAAAYSYYDCNCNAVFGADEQGITVYYDINKSHTSNITDNGTYGSCTNCPSPTPTPTPTITPSVTPSAIPVYSYVIYRDVGSVSPAIGAPSATVICDNGISTEVPISMTVYSSTSTFQDGMVLWRDSALTEPFNTSGTDFYFGRLVSLNTYTFKYNSGGNNQVEEYGACP